MDSIDVSEKMVVTNRYGILFTIQQESIRFEKLKTLALYIDYHYRGTYRIADKVIFELGKVPRHIALLMLGTHESLAATELRNPEYIKTNGRMSNSTIMAFLALHFVEYAKRHEIQKTRK